MRLGAMGDVIHTMYAVSLLRHALPEAQIGWVVEERWAELLCAKCEPQSGPRSTGRPLVDFLHLVNTKAWRRAPLSAETRRGLSSVLKQIREQKYELAVDFQGAIKSGLLARLACAQAVIGMDKPRETPAKLFYSVKINSNGPHVVDHSRALARAVLLRSRVDDRTEDAVSKPALEFPNDENAEMRMATICRDARKPIVLLNPGAGWGAKEWPPERYGQVARALGKEGYSVFVNYGPGEDPLAGIVRDASGDLAHPINCSIAELIALTRRASLFIGGDTGPLHLAAALKVPVIALFGPTDPARNGPYGSTNLVFRDPASHTSLSHTRTPDPGLLKISPADVLTGARKLLEETHA